ncbi:MAG TPA: sigma 54-interacting transcriptional regulator, partial [Polyangiaceae bacterium]|nr:sigma 54-interacting transcriptional regulator [Polyangiaceae bacterium]
RPQPLLVNYSKVRVTVVQGPDAGVTRELASESLRVGSSSDNDLALTDNTVSRRHCAIEPLASSGGVRIRDEGSTNGVFIGALRVFDAVVNGAAQVRVGDTVLSVEPLSEVVAREQAVSDRFCNMIGHSPRMRELFADLARIAPSDVTVLIEGETGSGKELVAESVHAASLRADGPLVVFDCSSVAPTLAESELFGHERGAFTGAVAARAGVFEQADGGSIFLDELGELPKDLQPKLLRVLERREVRRLGSQRTIPVDVRLIAATNRNLAAEVQRGNFREDLYFRLAAAHVRVPPLRDRMEDLPLLVEHFLTRTKPRRTVSDIPQHVWTMFNNHRWPGNVRELWNAVQRFSVTPERILSDDFSGAPPSRDSRPPAIDPMHLQALPVARREASEAFERNYLEALLRRTDGSVMRAAAVAEVSRQMVQKLMRKHGLE